ncbi:MAG: histidinol-phosphatase HisJ family protein [Candidatus Izimaplasma sp.]|nr:histidinol-phosphatase HisJ family protein [Candidatus Izimaplasma bacterium]
MNLLKDLKINTKVDTHVHTNYSPDADEDATFSSYITQAKKMGLTELIFTDHVDFDAAHPLFKTPINYDTYIKEFNSLKNASDFPIKLGVEIGYQSHVKEEIKSFLTNYNFEYVILSIHYLEKKDLYTQEYFTGKTKKESYTRYFKTCLEAVQEISNFDTFGHLDYLVRYSPFGDYEYREYKKLIDQILRELIKKNKALEINTSGLRHNERCYPKKEVINRFIELGGKKITLGSDSHHPSELATAFNRF